MLPIGLNEIREHFLQFFEAKDHLRLPSFPLVPHNDPSVLLINAGMTPLKPYFTGAAVPPAPRVVTCQKCIRTPDIDRVGKTSRHGTFFEMLGNFSFGDYFKAEVIPWAWEFCTVTLAMPVDRLYVSIYHEDDEAAAIWRDTVGLPESRIVRLGKEDNFWEHGTGPCGPSSEVYFDRGAEFGCGKTSCAVGCDCDRYVEFWNLVFTQFNREADGSYTPLAKRNIDTGLGLERLACLMQGVNSIFEVDTIRAILDGVCRVTGIRYGADERSDMAARVICDHIRSVTMMMADGILPSNEGRGYVLRRLLRRAARFGRLAGLRKPFLAGLVRLVVAQSGDAYPEIRTRQVQIEAQIDQEESRFLENLQQGTILLDGLLNAVKASGGARLDGEDVFRLHDTFGFPFDLTREIAAEQGLDVDEAGFAAAMNRQKATARAAFREKSSAAWTQAELPDEVRAAGPSRFVGYDTQESDSVVLGLLVPGDEGMKAAQDWSEVGSDAIVITAETPFYGAAGGQTGDIGRIEGPAAALTVTDTTRTPLGQILHHVRIDDGRIAVGDRVRLTVDRASRLNTARNHTATHLLHRALRDVLGGLATQAGSQVSPDRLRFDFHHIEPLTAEQRRLVEQAVNQVVLRDEPVNTTVMTVDQARAEGAVALFDEKYGEQVRVVAVGDYSRELCGGTHLGHAGAVGLFRLLGESGIAAGVRRIEAVTGQAAWQLADDEAQRLKALTALLKAQPDSVVDKVEQLIERIHSLEKDAEAARQDDVQEKVAELAAQAENISGITVLAAQIDVGDAEQLRTAVDLARQRLILRGAALENLLIALVSAAQDKVQWVVASGKNAVARGLDAGKLVRDAAKITGGGGGGRADLAQAGGKDQTRISEALAALRADVRGSLQNKEN